MPSLLSLCLHSSTFNLPPLPLLLCSWLSSLLQSRANVPFYVFFFALFLPPSYPTTHINRAVPPPPATCTNDPCVTRADRLDCKPRPPGSPLLRIPRQGVLAWHYPGEQKPGLGPPHQIGSICVSNAAPNTNAVHLLILIHPPFIQVRGVWGGGARQCNCVSARANKLLRNAITSFLKGESQTGLIDAIAVVIKPFFLPLSTR